MRLTLLVPELIWPEPADQFTLGKLGAPGLKVTKRDGSFEAFDTDKLLRALERMIAGFPPEFDVNLGNLPYCVAPHLAEHIHQRL